MITKIKGILPPSISSAYLCFVHELIGTKGLVTLEHSLAQNKRRIVSEVYPNERYLSDCDILETWIKNIKGMSCNVGCHHRLWKTRRSSNVSSNHRSMTYQSYFAENKNETEQHGTTWSGKIGPWSNPPHCCFHRSQQCPSRIWKASPNWTWPPSTGPFSEQVDNWGREQVALVYAHTLDSDADYRVT